MAPWIIWCATLEFAKELVRMYRDLLTILDRMRKRHSDRDYYERLIDALDSIGSALTRMRARGVIDPKIYEEYERVLKEGFNV